ncbi:hypothetical protein [[Mycobacterium] crassicus]|uniref:Uncharacterized protein n=1 Tax=[Mycobacterium] crassicus TaxID=2872309 RepID=A0ABU5XE87_9MYCO|nr:hypothetical protein [Mycolicibacter sp. MYC098]MEB3020491.1 hypothetical protein [Mycolicibacter sp. MYC098]
MAWRNILAQNKAGSERDVVMVGTHLAGDTVEHINRCALALTGAAAVFAVANYRDVRHRLPLGP